MGVRRYPPWHYPRSNMPHRRTLRRWRKLANDLARAVGAPMACGICKRPLRQWGKVIIRHPRSYGRSRVRKICTACSNLIIHMIDVLEWHGAQDHLAPEEWHGEPMPEDVPAGVTPDLRPVDNEET